jgi:single-stranded-DNA-specific exonuclease
MTDMEMLPEQAKDLAKRLLELNDKRKSMTEEMVKRAIEIVEEDDPDSSAVIGSAPQLYDGVNAMDRVLLVYLPECHESIAGIVAGRVKERYGHPALVITNAEDGLKGSARSITAYHMYEGLTEVADIFTRFGGHAQAAGFSLPADRLEELRRRLNENCRLQDKDFGEVLRIDLNLPLQYANGALLRELELLEPTGQGNRRPLFGRSGLTLTGLDFYGANDIVCKLYTQDQGRGFELTMFRRSQEIRDAIAQKYGEETVTRLHARGAEIPLVVVYTIKEDTYHGGGAVQIIVDDYKI